MGELGEAPAQLSQVSASLDHEREEAGDAQAARELIAVSAEGAASRNMIGDRSPAKAGVQTRTGALAEVRSCYG